MYSKIFFTLRRLILFFFFAFVFLSEKTLSLKWRNELKDIYIATSKAFDAREYKKATKEANKLEEYNIEYDKLDDLRENEFSFLRSIYIDIRNIRAMSLCEIKDFKKAMLDFNFILKRNSDSVSIINYADCLRKMGEKAKAYIVLEDKLNSISENSSVTAELHARIGWYYYLDKKTKKGIENTLQGINADPSLSSFQFNASIMYFIQGEEKKGIKYFFHALETLSREYNKESKLIIVIKDWDEQLKNKNSIEIQTSFWFLYKLKDFGNRKEVLKKNKTLNLDEYFSAYSKESDFLYTIAAFYSLQENWEKSDKYLKRVYELGSGYLVRAKSDKDFEFYFKNKKYTKYGIESWILKNNRTLKILLQDGHKGSVNQVFFSSDGRLLVTSSNDRTVKVWNTDNGKLLLDLTGHTSLGTKATLSPDNNVLATLDFNTTKLWSIKGKLLYELKGSPSSDLVFSPNGNTLITSGFLSVEIWNKVGKLIKDLQYNGGEPINISPDGKTIATTFYNNVNLLSSDGKFLSTLKGHLSDVRHIAFSPEGKKIAITHQDNSVNLWEANERLHFKLRRHFNEVQHVAFSPDGKTIATVSPGTAKVWSMNGQKIYHLDWNFGQIYDVKYSPDGKTLAIASVNHSVILWSLTEEKINELIGHAGSVFQSSFSPDGKTIATASMDGTAKIWSINGKLLFDLKGTPDTPLSLKGKSIITRDKDFKSINTFSIFENLSKVIMRYPDNGIRKIEISPDEKKIATLSFNNIVEIWDFTGNLLQELKENNDKITALAFSPNGDLLATGSIKGIVKIWSTNGKFSQTIEGHHEEIQKIVFSADNKTLATTSLDRTVKIWNKDGKLLNSLTDFEGYGIFAIAFSPDGKKLITVQGQNKVKEWNIFGEQLLDFDLEVHSRYINDIKYSPDGKVIIFSSGDNSISVWKLEPKPTLLQILVSHSNEVQSTHFINNGHILVSLSEDRSIKYWNWNEIIKTEYKLEKGDSFLQATQMFFDDNSSLVYTPEGYFDYQGNSALSMISYQSSEVQSGFIDMQDLMSDYYIPDLLALILRGNFEPDKKDLSKGINTLPYIEPLFPTQKKIFSNSDKTNLSFEVTERNGGKLDEAVVFVNGIQFARQDLTKENKLKLINDDEVGKRKIRLDFDLPLKYGNNRIEIKVYNSERVPQSYPTFEVERYIPKNTVLQKPDLYLLAVGIKNYPDNHKLEYADKDAEDIKKHFSQMEGTLYSEVHKYLLTNEQATKKAIEDKFLEIQKNAKPDDVVLVYFSGHGMNALKTNGKRIYYLVPQDFLWSKDTENPNVAKYQGINSEYLDDVFMNIKSQKLVLILDSCYSGAVSTAMVSKGDDSAMKIMANGTGRFIFASSSGNEISVMRAEIEQSIYTHVLLNALGANPSFPNADSIKKEEDGYIFLSEIRSYIDDQFKKQTSKFDGEIQTPPSIFLGRNSMYERVNDFPIYKLIKNAKE